MTEEGGASHTINLCRDWYDRRLIVEGESKVSNAAWKDMVRQKTSRGRLRAAFGSDGFLPKKNAGAIHCQIRVGQAVV